MANLRKKGFDLSKALPESTLMPLRRDGLDPVPDLGAMRRKAPVTKLKVPLGVNVWLVTGYEEAKAVLGDAGSFSNDFTNLIGTGVTSGTSPGGLGFADPPDHTRLRRLLTPEFTMRRLSRLTPRIHTIVEERLAEMAAATGPVDLVEAFAMPIPSLVICELLGVPYEDREEFQRLGTSRFDVFSGADASFGAISESLSYLRDIVKKERENPGDGLLGMLVREHGDAIDDEELAGLADGVLTGGLETTASMLALGTLLMLQDRQHFTALLADDAAIDPFVDELLRYLTVVQVAFPRFARRDLEIGGQAIGSGDIVLCSLSGADRDEHLGPHMEEFDPTRPAAGSHLAFGHGIHRCIGAELAKMELRAAYPALVRRFPEMTLAVPAEELRFRKYSVVFGMESLPVNLG
ncbi:cytochrome P450 [Streptantibioticus cattleyicolor]|uniref:Cytochrome P450 n=1 Tax=Streptantibioticus cattleyicolor (strain ATCC 35852 / DSM 46488 / JCM 4925 / NBRC 14057 / NRRL 8057) TaxID=1003195 RepID=F8JNB7_STREN|nr:cytochrome P450 [Streptantibioticus cattleyicolor NRRL 8057 = DSM 46488]CCB71834.1 Cytochrome P450 [Streptantibioticus cattleyicolor NRRL 8057 = DSM 46488]